MTDPTQPGPDELAVKERLITLVDGPAAAPAAPTIPPQPTARPRDWLDDLLDDNAPELEPVKEPAETAPESEPDAPKPSAAPKKPKARKTRRNRPRRHDPAAPRSAWDSRPPAPRQSLLDAWDRVPYRLKWLAIHLAGAAVGWKLGLVQWAANTAAWYAAGHWTSPSAWVLYVFGGLLAALHRAAHQRAWPVRLLAAIPIASAAVGLLLYGTDYMNLRIPW